MMKRQRNGSVDGHNVKATKAEGKATATKMAVVKKKSKSMSKREVEKVEEERKNISTAESSLVMVETNFLGWEDQWPWLRGVVDEQMSWGSIWSPVWDVEYMGEACSEMFSDVVWDYDIWNLKSINKIPNA